MNTTEAVQYLEDEVLSKLQRSTEYRERAASMANHDCRAYHTLVSLADQYKKEADAIRLVLRLAARATTGG